MVKSETLYESSEETFSSSSNDFLFDAKSFFYEVKRLYFNQERLDEHIKFYSMFNSLNISVENTGEFFSRFKESWGAAYKKGNECNVWEVAGVGNNEVQICSILAWLLDQNGTHGQGDLFLKAILNMLINKTPDNYLGGKINTDSISDRSVVYVESLPLGERESRVDIEIEGNNYLLFIEAKIHAPEQKNQLKRYLEIAKTKSAGRPYIVSLLTLNARNPDSQSLINKIICFSWQDCARVISRVIDDNSVKENKFVESIVMQFCDYITDLGGK